ncbi:MAG TPA: cupin domain-containing protein [Herpetosiphonaceae bacterium]|nr:cupin domain-containing protein [Herpetosiphonaceae bacterium]
MIEPGFVIENPYAQTRILLLPSPDGRAGTGWLLEVRRPPGTGPDNSEHFHATWTETFEVVSGTARYRLNGVEGARGPGERVVMPPRQPHIHPWNAGADELVYRQHTTFSPPDPRAMQEVLGGLATIARLGAQGGLSGHGQPKNLLQRAVTLKLALAYGRYDARAPRWLQTALAATLGTLAKAMGYAAIDPQPDPKSPTASQ